MLLFITTGLAISVKNAAFQYIPCYCLSELNVDSAKISSLFQYIPCYCLSKMRSAVIRRNYSFQYIPCYCLSAPRVQYGKDFLYFNTSHVTVYRISHGEILWKKEHFNTSHVTVYLAGIFEDWSNAVHFNTSHVTVYRSLHNH